MVASNFEANKNVTNEGTIYAKGHINFNANITVINKCLIKSDNDININAASITMTNGALIAAGTTTINGNSNLLLQNQSEVYTNDIMVNRDIEGSGSLNSIVVNGTSRINGQKKIRGQIS